MTIQTLFQMRDVNTLEVITGVASTDVIVAEEGSDLASQLRATGWVARSGWRRYSAGRPSVWLVRFECPTESVREAVA